MTPFKFRRLVSAPSAKRFFYMDAQDYGPQPPCPDCGHPASRFPRVGFTCSNVPSCLSCPSCSSMFLVFLTTSMHRIYRIMVLNRLAPIAGILRLVSRASASTAAAFRPLYPVHPVYRCSMGRKPDQPDRVLFADRPRRKTERDPFLFVSIRVHLWFVFINVPLFHSRMIRPVSGGTGLV